VQAFSWGRGVGNVKFGLKHLNNTHIQHNNLMNEVAQKDSSTV